MSLSGQLRTPRDLVEKLEREHVLLTHSVSSDGLFNFAVTSYCLFDWITAEQSIPTSVKRELSTFRKNKELLICRDIANASKHFTLNADSRAKALTSTVTSEQGYGVGRFGVGNFGSGEEKITIFLSDNTEVDVVEWSTTVLMHWSNFF